jgi:para-aminobenzoate synthetase component 2
MKAKERKVLFIDNFDSFTYNLVDDFCKRDCRAKVYRADTELEELKVLADEFCPDLLVISPGPGTPDTAGVSLQAIGHFKDKLPIFGVKSQSCAGAYARETFKGDTQREGRIRGCRESPSGGAVSQSLRGGAAGLYGTDG